LEAKETVAVATPGSRFTTARPACLSTFLFLFEKSLSP
jgi:hypothetical protein